MKRIRTHIIIAIVGCLWLSGCQTSKPSDSTANRNSAVGVAPFFTYEGGLALNGYDPVAYFNAGKAEAGRSEFEADWQGAKWRFASAENRQTFLRDPNQYAPQYGGYCSWAVGHGYTAKGDPEVWEIVNGKLYLNYNRDVKQKWEPEKAALIIKGDENWLSFQKSKPEHKGEGSN